MKKGFWAAGIIMITVFSALFGCAPKKGVKAVCERYGLVMHEDKVVIDGLREERTFVLIGDTHISLCDERDPEVAEKAKQRRDMFASLANNPSDVNFAHMMEAVKEIKPDLLVLCGDITDSAMEASVDFVKKELEKASVPRVYSMGNHDFEYGAEYFSARAYSEFLPRFAEVSDTADGYSAVEYDDLIVFATDDANNRILPSALAALKEFGGKNKPIILVNHVPLEPVTGDKTLFDKTIEVWRPDANGRSRVLIGYNSCVPDNVTAEFLEYVLAEDSPVKLVLSGHVHFYHRDSLNGKLTQIITGAGYEGDFVKITLVPGS